MKNDQTDFTIIMMGGFNARLRRKGDNDLEEVVGKYGLGSRNARGDIMAEFMERHD